MPTFIVYKVVKEVNNKYYSCVITNPRLKIRYELGKEAFPKIGKIIAFRNLNSALRFEKLRTRILYQTGHIKLRILKCKAKNIKPIDILYYAVDTLAKKDAINFWNKFLAMPVKDRKFYDEVAKRISGVDKIMCMPENSVYVNSLIPIEIVE